MDTVSRTKEIISRVSYATIATASVNAEPWNTPVTVAFDDAYNMYWTSLRDTQHSRNIVENPRVYISVYEPAVCGKDGVHIQAKAEELSDAQVVTLAIDLLYTRKKKEPRIIDEFLGETSRRLYRAVPEKFWISLDADAKIDPATAKKEVILV